MRRSCAAVAQVADGAAGLEAAPLVLGHRTALVARRQTEVNLQQNEQVKKISSWAAIIFAPTLIGTVYGMNFDIMPELHWEYGYPVALAVMVAFPTVLYLIFKRRRWL